MTRFLISLDFDELSRRIIAKKMESPFMSEMRLPIWMPVVWIPEVWLSCIIDTVVFFRSCES